MPSGIKHNGPVARPETSAASLPGLSQATPAPDTTLSSAFRHVLGAGGSQNHLAASPLKQGQEIARRAKAENHGAAPKGAPRKAHIGPRSGHK